MAYYLAHPNATDADDEDPESRMTAAAKQQGLDHGILNIPLAKRGDIDRELDAYKVAQAREQAAKAKEKAAETKEQRALAKALVATVPADVWERIGAKLDMNPAAVRKLFASEAHWGPANVIAALSHEEAA
jgi:hypothetical protein